MRNNTYVLSIINPLTVASSISPPSLFVLSLFFLRTHIIPKNKHTRINGCKKIVAEKHEQVVEAAGSDTNDVYAGADDDANGDESDTDDSECLSSLQFDPFSPLT